MANWVFHEHPPGAKVRDAIQGEFFAAESIDGPAEALVREAIQNAVDARPNGSIEATSVRLFVSTLAHAVSPERMARYTPGTFWAHVMAPGNGLKSPPSTSEPCTYVVVEDFGTTGLVGDTSQWRPVEGQKNPFFYFFRAEGLTDKVEGRAGSWGVGKTVFPRSSRVNGFFAVTVRRDDGQRLSMGSITLRTRTLGDTCFDPDGWFGVPGGPQGIVMPIRDPAVADNMARDFQLRRRQEPGLSVVIPWPDPEITHDTLTTAVLRQWFFPILRGRLKVDVESPERSDRITAESISALVERTSVREQIEPLLLLTRHMVAQARDPEFTLSAPPANYAPRWTPELIPEAMLPRLRAAVMSGNPVAIRIPLHVRPKRGSALPSHFDICIQRAADAAGRVTFIRDGILIPEVKHSRARGFAALVVCEDKPLAALLRDAEHPAHTHWSKDTSSFKEKYQNGPSYLSFVQQGVVKILSLLLESDQEVARDLLQDFFAVPGEEQMTAPVPPGRGPSQPQPPAGIPAAARKRRLVRVLPIQGGFSAQPNSGDMEFFHLPADVTFRVAYDVRRKNPLAQWSAADFDFVSDSIKIQSRGLTVLRRAGQELTVRIGAPDFHLSVRGFDERRDLVVEVSDGGGPS